MKSEGRNPKKVIGRIGPIGPIRPITFFGFRPSDFFRLSAFGLRVFALAFLIPSSLLAATNSDLDTIPPLRPPRGEIPPTFWEQHGVWIIAGGCFALLGVVAFVWWLARPKPPVVLPPEVQARQGIEEFLGQPESGLMLSRISQILRRYFVAAFALPAGELTTAEFCALITTQDQIGADLANTVVQFLRECDQRKFAPLAPQPPLEAANRALALIESAEKRRSEEHTSELQSHSF